MYSINKKIVGLKFFENNENKNNKELYDLFGKKVLTIARKYLGHPYDTSNRGIDGGGLKEWQKEKETFILDNFTGKIEKTNLEPLVCTDLVVKVLEELDLKKYIPLQVEDEEFDWRRTAKLEEALLNSQEFIHILCNIPITHNNHSNLTKLPKCNIGDIITSTSTTHKGRHIVIVSEVDSDGFPLKAIHSIGHQGVVETTFFNIFRTKDYQNKDRYSGSTAGEAIINYIFRPKIKILKQVLTKK